jgi:hypothetical protein
MLRDSRHVEMLFVNRDMKATCTDVCSTLQLSANRYTALTVQGCPSKKYDNQFTVVEADLAEIDLVGRIE